MDLGQQENSKLLKRIDVTVPPVISTGFFKSEYNANKIIQSLLKETSINTTDAKYVAEQITRYIIQQKIHIVTPPLIRELARFFLLQKGLEKEGLEYTRIGIAYYDMIRMLESNDPNVDQKILDIVKTQCKEVKKLIENNTKMCI